MSGGKMVSAYQMFAACVDLVLGVFEWVSWPLIVISWPLRVAAVFIFTWWSYITKLVVYGILNTILWPFQVISAARREKETHTQLLIAKHQLLQATAIAKDLTIKYEVAVEERTHARDALETCVEEKKRIKNKFHQAQIMLRKMDIERRRALEMAGVQPKDTPKIEAEEEVASLDALPLDNVNTDRHSPASPQLPATAPDPRRISDAQRLFLNAELENGHSEAGGRESDEGPSLDRRMKRTKKELEDGGLLPKASENSERRESLGSGRRESLGSGQRKESFGGGSRRESLGAGQRRESGTFNPTLDDAIEEVEDGPAGMVSTVVSCGLIGWTLVVLGASTAAILCLFVIMILPSLIGPGRDPTSRSVAEFARSLKWFVLGFVFCFYMETEEFSWFKQGLEASSHGDALISMIPMQAGTSG